MDQSSDINFPFETTLRPRYEETDRMGVIYHTNYIIYFEVGRTEYLRALGCRYRDLEAEGYLLAVVEAHARYIRSAEYDDELRVLVRIGEIGRSTVRLEYEIRRGDELLVTGYTVHAVLLKTTMKPARIPAKLKSALESGTGESR